MAYTPLNPFWEYWVDAVQRSAIFMDVLRHTRRSRRQSQS
jgi:hypothetical protein